MTLITYTQKLPAGLVCNGAEFYLMNGEIECLHAGRRHKWHEVPEWIFDIVRQDMVEHPTAIVNLLDWNKRDPQEQLWQYIFCRMGGFDTNPDITADGKIEYTEYWECGRRGQCKYEGKLCSTIKAPHGELTKRETEILKLVASGKMNKEIADMLCISEETVSSHNQNIQQKLGVADKLGMSIWAHEKNIVEPKI